MNFAFSEEQEELRNDRQAVPRRQVARGRGPPARWRPTEGYDQAVWAQMAEQLGLQGLIIPEEFGGSGLQLRRARSSCSRRWAARCSCAPYFSTVVLAANTLHPLRRRRGQEGAAARHRLRRDHRHPGLHRGERPLGRGGHHRDGHAGRRRLDAHRHQDVRARRPHRRPDPGGRPHRRRRQPLPPSPATPPGLTRTPLSTMDQTRKQAKLEFADTPGHASSAPTAAAGPCFERVLDLAAVGPGRRAGRRGPGGASTWPSSTPRSACSSAGPSARSRPSSTSAPTCCSRSSRPSRRPTTPAGAPPS